MQQPQLKWLELKRKGHRRTKLKPKIIKNNLQMEKNMKKKTKTYKHSYNIKTTQQKQLKYFKKWKLVVHQPYSQPKKPAK